MGGVLKLFLERGMGAEVRQADSWPLSLFEDRQIFEGGLPALSGRHAHASSGRHTPKLHKTTLQVALGELLQVLHAGFPPERTVPETATQTHIPKTHAQNTHKHPQVASLGELLQALHVGFPPERIVFDSPAKTVAELAFALEKGVPVNLDNFQVGTRLTPTCG